jgi:hypothetical protein
LRIFRQKGCEIIRGWGKLYNEELHKLYSSQIGVIKSRRMRRAGHALCRVEKRNAYRILEETPKGKRSLGRTRSR